MLTSLKCFKFICVTAAFLLYDPMKSGYFKIGKMPCHAYIHGQHSLDTNPQKGMIINNEFEGCKKGMLTILRDKVFSFFQQY